MMLAGVRNAAERGDTLRKLFRGKSAPVIRTCPAAIVATVRRI
jgi:hypothetical protein